MIDMGDDGKIADMRHISHWLWLPEHGGSHREIKNGARFRRPSKGGEL